ncbi:hypothetical protein BG842_03575 [Haladaptatus sp. W1]|nr:hypothetical protein BG842_03575 [Haladaptatus sp. W1]
MGIGWLLVELPLIGILGGLYFPLVTNLLITMILFLLENFVIAAVAETIGARRKAEQLKSHS